MDTPLDHIPVLNLEEFTCGDPERKNSFVLALGDAFNNIGFAIIENYGVDQQLIDDLCRVVESFFALPDQIKLKYYLKNASGQRGYIPRQTEQAQGAVTPDLKEFYHVGRQVDDKNNQDTEKSRHVEAVVPPAMTMPSYRNIFPKEIPDFERVTTRVWEKLLQVATFLLRAIALYLSLDEFYFDGFVKHGDSILRAIHYFSVPDPSCLHPQAVRAAPHTDINLISLLMGVSAKGLEVQKRDGTWIPANVPPHQLVVNVADMLSRLTNDRLRSTVHRVANPDPQDWILPRYSVPFFTHPVPSMDLTCLPSCVDNQHPIAYTPITAGQFLRQRLDEIGFAQNKTT